MESPRESPTGSSTSGGSSPWNSETKSRKDDKKEEGITVAIRMRPMNKKESDKRRVWKVVPKYSAITQTTNSGKPLPEKITGRTFFQFDKVFGEESSTRGIYDSVARGIIDDVVGGLNGTIFAYGQTSSGKTYTMQGSGTIQDGDGSSGGVVHMAARDIFQKIRQNPDRMFLVRTSFLEIYNEEVRDLLSDSNRTLPIREDPRRGVFVQSVEEIVTDYESLLRILFHGEKSRAVAATSMNERSSRSHTIFRVTIESREKTAGQDASDGDDSDEENRSSPGDGAVRISTLNLVDLAGSESVRHTGATGDRQKEGGMINQSLLTLSQVIVKLGQPNAMHINFRDSKLTRILQPSLSGNARMAVICCATPSELYLEETRSTLQFASRAKLVKTNAQVNEVLDERSMIRKLQKELAEAKRRASGASDSEQLKELQNKAASAGSAAVEAKAKLSRLKASILNVGSLFANQADPAQVRRRMAKARKRRQSEGEFRLGILTPTKINKLPLPSTLPRPTTTHRLVVPQKLDASAELEIVQAALSSKVATVLQMEESIQKCLGALDEKQRKIDNKAAECQDLIVSNESQQQENQDLAQMLGALRDELQEVRLHHEQIVSGRDNELKEAMEAIRSSTAEKSLLDEQISSLEAEAEEIKHENMRSAFTIGESLNAKEKLLQEKKRDAETMQKLNARIQSLEEENGKLQEHSDQVAEALRNESSNVEIFEAEIESLEHRLESAGNDLTLTTTSLEQAKTKIEEQSVELISQNVAINEMREKNCKLDAESKLVTKDRDDLFKQVVGLTEKATQKDNTIASVQEEAEALRRNLAESVNELSSLRLELVDKESKAEKLDTTISELQEVQGQYLKLKIEYESFASSAAANQESLSSKVESLEAEKVELDQSIQTAHTMLQNAKTSCEGLQEEVTTLQQTNLESANTYNQTIEEQTAANSALQNTISDMQGQLDNLQQQAIDHQQQYDALLAQSDERTIEIADLQQAKLEAVSQLAESGTALASANKTIQEQTAAHSALQKTISDMQGQLDNLQQQAIEHQQQYDALLAQSDERAIEIAALEGEKQQLSTRLDDLNALLASLRDEIDAYKTRESESQRSTSEYASHNDVLQKQVSAHERQHAALCTQNTALQDQIATLNQAGSESLTQLAEAKAALVSCREQLELCEERNMELHNMNKTLEEAINELKRSSDEKEEQHNTFLAVSENSAKQLESLKGEMKEASTKLAEMDNALIEANEEIRLDKQRSVEFQHTMEDLEEQVARQKSEIEKNETMYESLASEAQSDARRLDIVEHEKGQALSKFTESRLALEAANEELDRSKQQSTALQETVANLEEQLLVLKNQCAEQDERHTVLIANAEANRKQIDCVQSDKQQAMIKLMQSDEAVEQANKQLDTCADENLELKEIITNLETQFSEWDQKYSEQRDALEEEYAALRLQHGETTKQVSCLEEDKKQALEKLAELESAFSSAEAEVEVQTQHNLDLQQTISNLQGQVDELSYQVAEQRDQSSTQHAEGIEMSSRLNQLEEEKQTVVGKLEKSQTELTRTMQALDSNSTWVEGLSAATKEKDDELLKVNSEIAILRDTAGNLAAIEAEYDNLRQVLSAAEDTAEDLRRCIIALEGDKRCLEEEVDALTDQTVRTHDIAQFIQADLETALDSNIKLAYEKQAVERQLELCKEEVRELETAHHSAEKLSEKHQKQIVTTTALLADVRAENAHLKEIGSSVQALQKDKQGLQDELSKCEERLSAVESDATMNRRKQEEGIRELQSSREALLKKLDDLVEERDNSMTELEKQYEEGTMLTKKLEQAQKTIDGMKKGLTKISALEIEVTNLKDMNSDLKQLLDVSNASVEEARSAALAADDELKQKERELEDIVYRHMQLEEDFKQTELTASEAAVSGKSQTDLQSEIDSLLQTKVELEERILMEERNRTEFENELKHQMGEEQRALIQEGEQMMNNLRHQLQEMQNDLKIAETEGYAARQQIEVLRDKAELSEQQQMDATQRKLHLEGLLEKQEAQVSDLMSELSSAKAETYAQKGAYNDMRDRLRKADMNLETSTSESMMLRRKISKLESQVPDLQRNNDASMEEIQRLKRQLGSSISRQVEVDMKRELEKQSHTIEVLKERLQDTSDELGILKNEKADTDTGRNQQIEALQSRIGDQLSEIKAKDARIKKLEAVRLTKEQYANIKRMRTERDTFEVELKECKARLEKYSHEIGRLRDEISKLSQGDELSELRFDKGALQKKLRKYAAHCQHFEGEKIAIIDLIRTCNPDQKRDADLKQAVANLCSEVARLKNEQQMFSMPMRDSTTAVELERFREETTSLKRKLASSKGAFEEISRAQRDAAIALKECQEQLSRVTKEKDDIEMQIKTETTAKRTGGGGEEEELARKLKFLEQENLQLMLESKSLKKQIKLAREEIEMMKLNSGGEPTIDFGVSKIGGGGSNRRQQSQRESNDRMLETKPNADRMNGMTTSSHLLQGSRPPLSSNNKLNISKHKHEDKENTENLSPMSSPSLVPHSRKRRQQPLEQRNVAVGKRPRAKLQPTSAPGLGEAALNSEDTPAECQQS